MNTLRALLLLVADGVRRLLRDPMVLRSLAFPATLSGAVIIATVSAVAFFRPPGVLALTQEAALASIQEEAAAEGWPVHITPDPESWVREGRAMVGSDGHTIWTYQGSQEAVRLDALVRRHVGAGWYVEMSGDKASRARSRRGARHLLQFIGALFSFYGVVFGAGAVARDRDQGTLEAELTLPVPMWVHGAARWIAASLTLSVFWAFSISLLYALMGSTDPFGLLVHGVSACAASVAIGIAVIGRAGLERGFVGPMSGGLVIVVSLLSFGFNVTVIDQQVPIASVLSGGNTGLYSLAWSGVMGVVAVGLFTWRGTVT